MFQGNNFERLYPHSEFLAWGEVWEKPFKLNTSEHAPEGILSNARYKVLISSR
jgi:hypothetical protein